MNFRTLTAALLLALAAAVSLVSAPAAAAAPLAASRPILPLGQIKPGMKGYGLTVFAGTTIEPFRVEVLSVMRDFAPNKGVIWVRCPDERMQKSGPVAGMSGSPIYLWGEGEAQEPGKGGKLIGAFAFGYRGSKDCFVGIQPIEAMLAAGERAGKPGTPRDAAAGQAAEAAVTLRDLVRAAGQQNLPRGAVWRAQALAEVLGGKDNKDARGPLAALPPNGPEGIEGQVIRLMLPLPVRSAGVARLMGPLLERAGIAALAAPPGTVAGKPPHWIDPKAIKLAPGSVVSIPLGFGDLDVCATGTVTDVLPDGRVLAFGHPMFGQGRTAMPMATGYVHLIMPGILNSFKLGGSGAIQGAIVQDEGSAIVGRPDVTFANSPVHVKVRSPGQPEREYHYRVVRHRALTPMIAGMLAVESIGAETSLPLENTVRVEGKFSFAGAREIALDTLLPAANEQALAMNVIPVVSAMVANPHGSAMLEGMDLTVTVEPVIKSATLVNARLDQAQVAPGDTLGLTLRLQPYGKAAVTRRVEMKVPESLTDGEYSLTVCDVQQYTQTLLQSRPHLQTTTNLDDVTAVVQQIVGLPDNGLYLLLQLPNQGVAVGRQELPHLPSSRRAMFTSPTSTVATPFSDWARKLVLLDCVPSGQLNFNITVRKEATAKR